MNTTIILTINRVLSDFGCDPVSYIYGGLTAASAGSNGVILSDEYSEYRYDDASKVLDVLVGLHSSVTPEGIIEALGKLSTTLC